jgi:hypothetical protein
MLGKATRGFFETCFGHAILTQDRIPHHGAAGAVACRLCSAWQDSTAKIAEGADECGVGRAVRAGLGVPAAGGTHGDTNEQYRAPDPAAPASGQGCWPGRRVWPYLSVL